MVELNYKKCKEWLTRFEAVPDDKLRDLEVVRDLIETDEAEQMGFVLE